MSLRDTVFFAALTTQAMNGLATVAMSLRDRGAACVAESCDELATVAMSLRDKRSERMLPCLRTGLFRFLRAVRFCRASSLLAVKSRGKQAACPTKRRCRLQ